YSGEGSEGEFADRYCGLIQTYIRDNNITSVVDLGCGDFTIGSRLSEGVLSYRGIDIVPELIEYNTKTFGSERITFECIDIVEGSLPAAQLCLVRQVLQHLSNAEIVTALKKLSMYPHVIVTEHVPVGYVAVPNKDKAHGPDQRLYDGSGVFLSEPPFSRAIEKTWELPYKEKEKFLLVLMKNPTALQTEGTSNSASRAQSAG
ncbi:MAG: class I SAM-dependent methyltransferase, partial [Bryobacteraceae bacterium]